MNDRWNPYEIVACAPNRKGHFTSQPPEGIPSLRSYDDVSLLCERGLVDIVVLASASAARAYAAVGSPAPAVSIGPQTTQEAKRLGVEVRAEAESHDVDGIVAAVRRIVRPP